MENLKLANVSHSIYLLAFKLKITECLIQGFKVKIGNVATKLQNQRCPKVKRYLNENPNTATIPLPLEEQITFGGEIYLSNFIVEQKPYSDLG